MASLAPVAGATWPPGAAGKRVGLVVPKTPKSELRPAGHSFLGAIHAWKIYPVTF
jgi:hypothetical protein